MKPEFSDDINFRPFVGENYQAGTKFGKLLILGESHYHTSSTAPKDFTVDLLTNVASGTWKLRFFSRISRIVTGKAITQIDRSAFWNSIAFYNYVQFIVGDKSKVRPTKQMWLDSVTPFHNVIEILKPDTILVCGKELATNLPSLPNKIKIITITHPSSPKFGKVEAWVKKIHSEFL